MSHREPCPGKGGGSRGRGGGRRGHCGAAPLALPARGQERPAQARRGGCPCPAALAPSPGPRCPPPAPALPCGTWLGDVGGCWGEQPPAARLGGVLLLRGGVLRRRVGYGMCRMHALGGHLTTHGGAVLPVEVFGHPRRWAWVRCRPCPPQG